MTHFVLVGAGALGSILAAHLLGSGHKVTLLARGERAKYLTTQPLSVTGLLEHSALCSVVIEPRTIQHCDVLVLAVKTYHMADALRSLSHIKASTIFSLANGVSKTEQMQQVFDSEAIMGCVADFSGELKADGTARYTRNNCLYLGERHSSGSERLNSLVQLLADTGLKTLAVDDIEQEEWSKFVIWVPVFLLAILSAQRTGEYLSDSVYAQRVVLILKEMGELTKALGVVLLNRSVLPAAKLLALPQNQAIEEVREIGRRLLLSAPNHKMSALQDYENGKPLEIEETVRYALDKAVTMGIAMPETQLAYNEVGQLMASR
jgi:2-dehydropantoate 2-reductase